MNSVNMCNLHLLYSYETNEKVRNSISISILNCDKKMDLRLVKKNCGLSLVTNVTKATVPTWVLLNPV